ncbi:restriction endonuclease [Deferrisoma palaeochoriense]
MTIWAFNKPGDEYLQFVVKSLRDGVSRFGWSYFEGADLEDLKKKSWGDMDDDEKKVWAKASFLLDIQKDDWIVHINVPRWGFCSAARVQGEYYFDKSSQNEDYRHCVPVDKSSIVEFDRNDPNVHPLVSRKLKLRGRYWRVYCEKEFFESINRLKESCISLGDEQKGLYYLKQELSEPLGDIAQIIHKTHDGKNLERFLAAVFREVPFVEDVIENGFGWGTDYGADLIVEYHSGLPVPGLEKTEKLVVQIKSYEGEHWDTSAVDQIEEAIAKYDADAGLILTTAQKTNNLQKAVDQRSEMLQKPISVLAGEDLAKFVLKYYGKVLFE